MMMVAVRLKRAQRLIEWVERLMMRLAIVADVRLRVRVLMLMLIPRFRLLLSKECLEGGGINNRPPH